jgi:hypothetical protein
MQRKENPVATTSGEADYSGELENNNKIIIKKMKKRISIGITVIAFYGVLFSGCSKLPQEEIDATYAAVNEAFLAGADQYAPESYLSLQDSLKTVMVSVEGQKSRFIRNYSDAREQLIAVTGYAGQVKQEAEQTKEELRVEAENLVFEVRELINSNRKLILEAPKGKEGTSALLAIRAENDAVESTVNEVSTLLTNSDFISAADKVRAARDKALSLNTELSKVIARYKANLRSR